MITADRLKSQFALGLDFKSYLATAKANERPGWDAFTARVKLSAEQRALIASFERQINVLIISGTWCGDCVQQVPILAAIAECNPKISLRLIDRDANLPFADHFKICGGHRVPAVIFMNEDFDFVSLLGDKTLARFRRLAAASLGASCPMPGAPVPADEVAAVTQEWINEFERVALLCRLSAKLRQRHGD